MRLKYITGLDDEELDDLVMRVEKLLPKPWNKATGRPRKLSPRDAVAITCADKRQNIIQEVLGATWDVSQELVSEVITAMTPLIKEATREFVPTPEDAVAMVTGRVCLVDGSLDPCWSWESHDELWTRKHGTTGHKLPGHHQSGRGSPLQLRPGSRFCPRLSRHQADPRLPHPGTQWRCHRRQGLSGLRVRDTTKETERW
jgi:hypothetical protein